MTNHLFFITFQIVVISHRDHIFFPPVRHMISVLKAEREILVYFKKKKIKFPSSSLFVFVC